MDWGMHDQHPQRRRNPVIGTHKKDLLNKKRK